MSSELTHVVGLRRNNKKFFPKDTLLSKLRKGEKKGLWLSNGEMCSM